MVICLILHLLWILAKLYIAFIIGNLFFNYLENLEKTKLLITYCDCLLVIT